MIQSQVGQQVRETQSQPVKARQGGTHLSSQLGGKYKQKDWSQSGQVIKVRPY
jgi:hypothetical protein